MAKEPQQPSDNLAVVVARYAHAPLDFQPGAVFKAKVGPVLQPNDRPAEGESLEGVAKVEELIGAGR